MSQLIIKDTEFIQVERYVGKFMEELEDLCKQYIDLALVIHKEGLEGSAIQKVIIERLGPIFYFYAKSQQGIIQSAEFKVEVNEFLENELKKFVSRIDEIDSVLY